MDSDDQIQTLIFNQKQKKYPTFIANNYKKP